MTRAYEPSLERARPLRRGGVAVVRGARGLLRVCLLLILLIVLLVAVVTGSARVGLPFLSAYKPTLENRLSEYLESPVTIDELDTRWEGTGPLLRARGVELTDPEGRSARFDELLIDVNVPRSILAGGPVMDELTLVGADLAMSYDRSGGLRINGLSKEGGIGARRSANPSSSTSSGGGFNAVAWLLTASRVGMLDTQLSIALPDGQSMVLDDLNIRVENDGDLHQVRMDMVLPDAIGNAFEVGVDVNGDANKLSSTDGNFYLKAADFKANGLAEILNAYEIDIPFVSALAERGTEAQMELWGELASGNVQRVNGRTVIAQSAKIEGSSQDSATEGSLFGNLYWVREDEDAGWQFAATDVVVGRTGEESVFNEIRLGTSVRNGKKPEWLTLQTADTELLPVLNTVSSLLPSGLPSNIEALLNNAGPNAKIRTADIQLALASPATSASASITLDDVAWRSVGKFPGASFDTLVIDMENGRGTVSMLPQTVTVYPPALDKSANGAKALELAQVAWNARIDLPNQSLEGGLTVQDKSATLALQHSIDIPNGASPKLDIQGQFVADSVLDVKPWLTQSWMPAGSRNWIRRAVNQGKIQNGTIRVEGRLNELSLKQLSAEAKDPAIRNNNTTAKISFDAVNVNLDYLDTWPVAKAVNANVVLDKLSLTSRVSSGQVAGLPIAKAWAQVAYLRSPELVMSLASETSLASLVRFGNTGPLQSVLKPIFDGSEVSGPARLEVALVTPLWRPPLKPGAKATPWPVDVDGSVFLKNSNVKLAAVDLPLTEVRGPVNFTEDGVSFKTLRGKLFGSVVRLNAASVGKGRERRTDIAVRTVAEGRKLLDRYELPIAEFVSGSSNWRADASVPHDAQRLARDGIALTVVSDMVGTTIDLAEPLGKRSGVKLPIKISTRFFEDTNKPQLWRFRVGTETDIHSDTRITIVDNELDGMVMSLGASLRNTQPESGIRVYGSVDVLSIDGVVTDIADLIDALPETEGNPEEILPVSVEVYAKQMQAGLTRLGDVSVKVNTDDTFINMFVNNAHLRGSLRYPREHWSKDIQAKVRLNFADKIFVDALSSGAETAEPPERIDPTTLPPIDAHVSLFQWDKLLVKNLRIRTEPDAAGLRVRTFGFATGTTQLIGEGLWHLVDAQNVNPNLIDQQRAQLHLTLQSSNLGNALSSMGFDGVMANGEGEITASLNWPDAFYAPSVDTVAARATLDISRGSLLQIEPGAARLAGIFALQTLPRRLSLDFSDIVNDGLDFATIKGDIAVESGVVNTRLVQLNGPIGVVDITGFSDLVAQEFDQQVTVLPRVSAALPIIGIITGGATAGIGAVVAGGVLKALGVDFDRLGLLEYSLTGGWQDPKFKQIGR